ncbi:efflux RND transporter periplasmic adaptor subunit [Shewanella sp. Koi 1]
MILRQSCQFAIFFSAIILALFGCEQAPVEVKATGDISRPAMIVTLQPQGISQTQFTGVVRSAERAELAFKQSGKLASMTVQEGDKVSRGQTLATLDDAELKTALNSANVEFKQAQTDFERGNKIFSTSQAISRSDLDQLKVKRDLAANKVAKAQQDLANASLNAPFDGTVAQKLVNNFATVQPNQPVYVVHNPANLEVMINVPGKLFLEPNAGQRAVAEIEGLAGQRFGLTYRYYAADADPVSQTYQVVLGFDDPSAANLLPGMNAKVYPVMDSAAQNQHLLVPVDAVVPSNTGSQFVWLVNADSRVAKRSISVGNILGNQIQVTEGLSPGDKIVVAGVHALAEGIKVHPMQSGESN